MNVIGELLKIKEFREDKAELQVARARDALDEAARALETVRCALSDYRQSCAQQKLALYADLCSRLVQRRDIDDVAYEVDRMRDGVHAHEGRVTSAEDVHESAVKALELARVAYREASRAREKFCELGVTADEDRLLEEGRAEDLEMEDVVARARASDSEFMDATG